MILAKELLTLKEAALFPKGTQQVALFNIKDEIPFELLPSGHILVKAKIDNVQGSFIFDTGAGISRGKSLTILSYFKINDTLNLQLSLDAGAGKDIYRLNAKYLNPLNVDISDTLQVKKIQKKSEVNEAFVSTIYTTHLKHIAATDQPTIAVKDFPVQFVEGLIYDGIIWIIG